MEIQFTIDILLSLSIIGSSVYLAKTYSKENKRKNVAALKKYRIEILDKALKGFNYSHQNGKEILKKIEENSKKPNFNFEETIDDFINFYQQTFDKASSFQQDFSVWTTDSQRQVIDSIIILSENNIKQTKEAWEFNKNNSNLTQKDIPFFDDFLQEYNELINELRDELDSEISQY